MSGGEKKVYVSNNVKINEEIGNILIIIHRNFKRKGRKKNMVKRRHEDFPPLLTKAYFFFAISN